MSTSPSDPIPNSFVILSNCPLPLQHILVLSYPLHRLSHSQPLPYLASPLTPSACEIQANAFARRYPTLRIASLRFHAVTPDSLCTPPILDNRKGLWKDLWGWVSLSSTATACLSALTVPEQQFPLGHETFFIVAPTTMQQRPTLELLRERFPELVDEFGGVVEGKGNLGLISTDKARRMLGWEEEIDNRSN